MFIKDSQAINNDYTMNTNQITLEEGQIVLTKATQI